MGSAEWARRINSREWGPEERYLNLDAFWLHPKPLPHGKHGRAKAEVHSDVSPNGGGGWVDVRGASPNDLELSSVRFACWHPYITHLKDEDGFSYLYIFFFKTNNTSSRLVKWRGSGAGGRFLGSAEWARRMNTASPNDLELRSVRFACWHPYITHLKDEDCFFYLYKNLNACVPSRRCLSSSGSIYLYKNLNACGKPPQGGTESTGTTCQGSKHLDFYINKKPPQGAQKARGQPARDGSI